MMQKEERRRFDVVVLILFLIQSWHQRIHSQECLFMLITLKQREVNHGERIPAR